MNKIARILLNKHVVSGLFYALFLVFLVLYIRSTDFTNISMSSFSWFYVFLAALFGLATRFWSAGIWFFILKRLGAVDISNYKTDLTYVYAKSWLGRYIPGTAPWILGKIYFASKFKISKQQLGVSSILEAVIQISTLVGVSFLFLIFDNRLATLDQSYKLVMFVVFILCFVFLIPKVFNYLIQKVLKLLKRKQLQTSSRASSAMIIGAALLYIIGSMLNGLSLFYIAKSVFPELPYSDVLFVIGAGNLAGALGMLAIFVPSGIGVREGAQLLLLTLIMPNDAALVVTVATRLFGVIYDLMFWVIAGLSNTIKKKMHRKFLLEDT